jgi:hypothetical protein
MPAQEMSRSHNCQRLCLLGTAAEANIDLGLAIRSGQKDIDLPIEHHEHIDLALPVSEQRVWVAEMPPVKPYLGYRALLNPVFRSTAPETPGSAAQDGPRRSAVAPF